MTVSGAGYGAFAEAAAGSCVLIGSGVKVHAPALSAGSFTESAYASSCAAVVVLHWIKVIAKVRKKPAKAASSTLFTPYSPVSS